MTEQNLIKKYDVPVPRYTSYPTVPAWSKTPANSEWANSISKSLTRNLNWSAYVHLPFCESLCAFCGCTKQITKNHGLEADYISLLRKELDLYIRLVPELQHSKLRQLHLGGGSPTFFSPENLGEIIRMITRKTEFDPTEFEGSFEVDPRRVVREHFEAARNLGLRRVSLGVQDFDPEVQKTVRREQPYELTAATTKWARELGFESVNFDLIYGLPKQTPQTIRETVDKVIGLKPDRIALYSLALVPWLKPSQKLFKAEELPVGDKKRELYEIARNLFLEAGYLEIGMDHFALPNDPLALALKNQHLHRNFMGYTERATPVLLGFGVSAIGESADCFHQNAKDIETYRRLLDEGVLPTEKGHILSPRDRDQRRHILDLMTTYSTEVLSVEDRATLEKRLHEPFVDGLVSWHGTTLVVEQKGHPFVRNICAGFDDFYSPTGDKPTFSKSI